MEVFKNFIIVECFPWVAGPDADCVDSLLIRVVANAISVTDKVELWLSMAKPPRYWLA